MKKNEIVEVMKDLAFCPRGLMTEEVVLLSDVLKYVKMLEDIDNLNPPSVGSVSHYPTYNPTADWVEEHHTIMDERFNDTGNPT